MNTSRVSQVPGSLVRKTLFWAHLASGIAAGVIILILSVTGALLSYEKQIIAKAAQGNRTTPIAGQQPLSADRLVEAVRATHPDVRRFNLILSADPAMPVTASQGREFSVLLNPYTGATIQDASAGTRDFFRVIEAWHRRLAGTNGSAAASAVDIANLLFLFMTVSGLYVWLPAVWRWRTVKGVMLFRRRYVNAKMRDFSWHHVFGFWALIPLFVIALSGVVMSYPWANNLVYAAFGEKPPQRGQGPAQGPQGQAQRPGRPGENARPGQGFDAAGERGSQQREPRAGAPLDALLTAAKAQAGDWQRLTLPVGGRGEKVDVVAELRSSQPRPPRRTLVLNTQDASVVSVSDPTATANAQSAGQRARSWLRLAHTGEQYGIVGQTIGALACIAACFLVYTGFALAWRRLILPLFRRSTRTVTAPV